MQRITGSNHKELGFHTYDGKYNPYDVPLTLGEIDFDNKSIGIGGARRILQEVFEKLAKYEDTGLEPDEILSGVKLANIYAGVRKAQECHKETDPIKCIVSKKMMCCNLKDLFSKCDGISALNHSRYIVNTVAEAEFRKRKAELYVEPNKE